VCSSDLLQRGIEKFYRDCAESGVHSVLVADLPLEHAEEIVPIAKTHGIAPVFLVSEVTTEERMKKIAAVADGYLYVISYLGVTGVKNTVLKGKIRETIDCARKYSSLPLIVGFGINTPDQVAAAVKAGADGVIVGSRIIREIAMKRDVGKVCKELKASMHDGS
jgi:tryptophan synthase alpha chain